MLDDKKREILRTFADCNMSVLGTAKKLHFHWNTITYHLNAIQKKTGLDPRNFYDLVKLLEGV